MVITETSSRLGLVHHSIQLIKLDGPYRICSPQPNWRHEVFRYIFRKLVDSQAKHSSPVSSHKSIKRLRDLVVALDPMLCQKEYACDSVLLALRLSICKTIYSPTDPILVNLEQTILNLPTPPPKSGLVYSPHDARLALQVIDQIRPSISPSLAAAWAANSVDALENLSLEDHRDVWVRS